MDIPQPVSKWIQENYPKPHIDPEWLESCYEWLTTERSHSPTTNLQALLKDLNHQIVGSDLADSMVHGTGLPPNSGHHTTSTVLTGPPVLVQIISMTEIGSSAFQLDQVRASREERMQAGAQDGGDEEGDLEVEGEGPVPKYPRGMLKLELSDGSTFIEAMEYRPLPELILGVTPLGFKMQLKGARIHRGIVFLEPSCVIFKGGHTELENGQMAQFAKSLRHRMGLPTDLPNHEGARPQPAPAVIAAPPPCPPQPPPPANVRSPLREISPPPSPPPFSRHNDDEDLEPRRRKIPSSNTNNAPPRPPFPAGPSTAESSTLVPSRSATSSYFASSATTIHRPAPPRKVEPFDFGLPPTTREIIDTNPDLDDDFNFDLMDEINNENAVPPMARKGKAKATDRSLAAKSKGKEIEIEADSDDFGMVEDDLDLDTLQELDRAEMEALTHAPSTHPPSSGSLSGTASSSSALGKSISMVAGATSSVVRPIAGRSRIPPSQPMDVIVIEDDEDDEDVEMEDKENVPVPTRHVRRRTVENTFGLSRTHSSGRPVVRATNLNDIIDLSD